jgi:hypothetical protein
MLPLLQRRGNRKYGIIDVLILNISSAGFLKGEMAYGNVKQSTASPVRLRFKVKKRCITYFKEFGILLLF